MSGAAARPAPWGRLGAVAPVPFVGAAALLVALIVFTPVLLSSGSSPLAVQAELVVYRVPGGATTDFYLHAVGPDVPYAQVDIALGTPGAGTGWTGSCPTSGLTWNYTNRTNVLAVSVAAGLGPVVVNATAVYGHGASRTVYAAALAFAVLHNGTSAESVAIATCPWTPTQSHPASWPVGRLPLALLLVNYGSGGP